MFSRARQKPRSRNYRTGRASFFEYDHAGRCVASTERAFTVSNGVIHYGAALSSYRYEYDVCNNLTKLTCSVAGASWDTVYTYDKDNRPKTTTTWSGTVLTNTYDSLGRLTKRTWGLGSSYETRLEYWLNGDNRTTLLHRYYNGNDDPYVYGYDDNGNITSITQGSTGITYEYDEANRLTRENNQVTNQTVTYEYDTWGNILNKKIYAYTTATNPGTPTSTITYTYGNNAWRDQLTSYNGQTITYDAMGNPLTYRGYTFTWQGKQLMSSVKDTQTISFEYNEDGLRQKKTVNGVDTNYFYNGSVLIGMQRGTSKFLFSYDASGNAVSVKYNGNEYYYVRNGQGDIVKLIDSAGTTVVEYIYNSWGKAVTTTGSLAGTLGLIQPFRYRGYVYDWETGLYYLQSRYYDPTVGRFISADVLLSTGQGVLGHNCYAYCLDNPVGMVDETGRCSFFLCFKIKDCERSDCIFSEKYELSENNPFRIAKESVSVLDSAGAFMIGVGGNAGMGGYTEGSIALAVDTKGNIALLGTLGGGGGTPSASIFALAGISNARSVSDLKGPFAFMGASGGEALIVGGEYAYGKADDNSSVHLGVAQIGLGAKLPIPAEIHGGASYTWVLTQTNPLMSFLDDLGRLYDVITGN